MRAAPDPTSPVTVDVALEVRQPSGETMLFPVVDGRVTGKAMQDRTGDYVLAVTVPGIDLPEPGDCLSCTGQTARVRWVLSTSAGEHTVWSNMFLLESFDYEDGVIELSGHGVLSRVWDHQDTKARQWRAALARDVLASILATDRVPVRVDPSLPKDALPSRWVQGTDRWQAVLDLLASVSGLLREDEHGAVLKPQYGPIETAPELVLADGVGGTVVSAPASFDRQDRPNHVVVRGTDFVTGKDFAVDASERDGVFSVSRFGFVTEVIEGDEISRLAQAQLVASNTLALRKHYRSIVRVQAATDWRLELDDAVEVRACEQTVWGRIVGLEMPLSGLGTMTIEVGTE